MRKQTKIVAALSATALLALGASAVTFAAGWDNSTGTWQYLDNNGSAVTDVWRKSGDYWFYLDSDGNMATDTLVEKDSDKYYVNAEGAMVTNQWVALDSDSYDSNSDDGEAEYRWYYFGSDGKAYRNKKSSSSVTTSELKTINGKKYAFDADGKMLYGWVAEDNADIQTDDEAWETSLYYFGGWNDGAAQTGWVQLTVDTSSLGEDNDSGTYWFYFDGNGKKQGNEKGKKKTINGATYYFDKYGRMVDDWADDASKGDVSRETTASNVVYVNGDGSARKNQWVWAVPAEDYAIEMAGGNDDDNDYANDEYSWWWTQANGRIFTNGLKKIKGKQYAFDKYGRMLSGLVADTGDKNNAEGKFITGYSKDFTDLDAATFKSDSDYDKLTFYFFGEEEKDGSRKTGYQNVDFDDDTYQMYFDSNGKAVDGYNTTIKKYAKHGVILKADTDTSNYALVKVASDNYKKLDASDVVYAESLVSGDYSIDDSLHDYVLVNASGTVQKNVNNLKDNNDMYYFTNSEGRVQYVGGKLTTSKTSASDYSSDTKTATSISVKNKTYYFAD